MEKRENAKGYTSGVNNRPAMPRFTLQLASLTGLQLNALLKSLDTPKVYQSKAIYSWQSTVTSDCTGDEVKVLRDEDYQIRGFRIEDTERCDLDRCEYHGRFTS